jgi:hypothetical protein
LARADYTWGQWRELPWGSLYPLELVKQDLQLLNPAYLIVCPEVEDPRYRWEDC